MKKLIGRSLSSEREYMHEKDPNHKKSPKSIKIRTCFMWISFGLWQMMPLNALGNLSRFSIK